MDGGRDGARRLAFAGAALALAATAAVAIALAIRDGKAPAVLGVIALAAAVVAWLSRREERVDEGSQQLTDAQEELQRSREREARLQSARQTERAWTGELRNQVVE